jgi:predicted SAM-dependent methyltransferase
MKIYNIYTEKLKYWFILNRKRLSKCGIYQFVFRIYEGYYKFVSFYYSIGSNVVCPACGFVGKAFVNKSTCPKCWSGPRHRLLALYIQNILNPSTNSQILDVAPNRATSYIFDRKSYKNHISIDLDSPVAMFNMDLTDLTFKDNKFDLIICYHVLEHIKNDTSAMEEIYRVLKPNGTAILQVPFSGKNGHTFELDNYNYTDRNMNIKLYGHPGHVRRYGEKDYLAKLKSIGFNVQLDNYVKSFPDADIAKYGLYKNEILYVCRKIE